MARGQSLSAFERELEAVFGPAHEGAQQPAGEVPDLLEFIPAISAGYASPRHLAPIAALFQRALTEQVKAVISLPPRHGKTELLLHAIAWVLARNPAYQVAYLSATAALAKAKSSRARKLAGAAGVALDRSSRNKSDWRTTSGEGGLWACGIGGQINGQGFNLCLVDDPHKGRAEAESGILRDRVHDWLKGDAFPRLEPKGSIFVVHTRWHNDDLAGRLISSGRWENVCLPAINPKGEALWPERWSLEALLELQEELGGVDGYDWVSLYQGQPQPDGAAIFKEPAFYKALPPLAMARISIGVDFAYSSKRSADYSVAVVMAEIGGVCYVLDVLRFQGDIREFRSLIKGLVATYPGSFVTAYAAATEAGAVEFLREGGFPVITRRAITDKLSNALATSAAWNTGKILVPDPESDIKAPWRDKYLAELRGFSGKGDRNDDQVDGTVAAHEALRRMTVDWDYIDRLNSASPRAIEF